MTYDHREGLARIREVYRVPAHLGHPVIIDGQHYTIIGHDGARLLVSDPHDRQHVAHPTWKAEYPEVKPGPEAAEAILVRRVTQCVAEGLHAYGGHCDACGVSVK